ncbi:hypothetical protein evm_002394 [Chilo suppressalis]|nr:hypothetical protein evm_002394 [Chilo suppressalis]
MLNGIAMVIAIAYDLILLFLTPEGSNTYYAFYGPINVPTAGAQDGIARLDHDPSRGPRADWWVLTTAAAAGTNGLPCLPKHRGTRDRRFLVTHSMTDHCESCLTSTIVAERANHPHHCAPQTRQTSLFLCLHKKERNVNTKERKEKAKSCKYRGLGSEYDFVPFGVETLAPWGPSAIRLFKDIAKSRVLKRDQMAASMKCCLFGILVCFNVMVSDVESSQELIKKMSISFLKVLQECKLELSVPEEVLQSLMTFWNQDTDLSHRELGCVILCVVSKLDLIELETYKLHPDNANDYVKKHGADDETASQIMNILRGCEIKNEAISDHCDRVREIAKCFHGHMHELKWAPNMEVIINELVATKAI